jgi:hypothetical protein
MNESVPPNPKPVPIEKLSQPSFLEALPFVLIALGAVAGICIIGIVVVIILNIIDQKLQLSLSDLFAYDELLSLI